MNVEELREYCLSIKGATESFPFNETVLVFKVMDKMFVYFDIEPKDRVFRLNMKCYSERSVELRELYAGVSDGVHTRSLTWNTVSLNSDVPDHLIQELINHSVEEVIKKLSKKKQQEYNQS